jgi:hypothetical protein
MYTIARELRVLVLFVLASGLAIAAGTQDKEKFAQAQKQNSEALKQYTWKSRTEIKMKGESKNVKLEQIRYDIDGKLEKTSIGGSPEQQPQEESKAGRRGRRGRGKAKDKIVEKKKKEFAEMMQALGKLVASYGQIPPEKMQSFAQNAQVSQGEGDQVGTVRIQGGDVLQAGDAMTIWIDPATQMMRRVEIKTALEENPVTVVSDYQNLTDGPTYQARSVVDYPAKEIELTVENYDYQRVGS